MRRRHFSVTLIGFLFVSLFAGCSSLQDVIESAPKPSARILGAGVRNLSLQSLDLVFDVEVSNPYAVSLPLVDLNYTLSSGKQQFLAGGIKPSGSVPAKGSSVIQLPARLDLGAVMKALSGVRPGAVVPYYAEIDVVVDTPLLGQMNLPVKHQSEIPIPSIPEITLVSLDVAELGLDRVSATAKLRIKNTNQFQIDFSRLRFDLALGGKQVTSVRLRSSSKLARGQAAVIEIPISISPGAIGAGLLSLLSGSHAGYDLSGKLDVTTRFGELALPFHQGGEANVRR